MRKQFTGSLIALLEQGGDKGPLFLIGFDDQCNRAFRESLVHASSSLPLKFCEYPGETPGPAN